MSDLPKFSQVIKEAIVAGSSVPTPSAPARPKKVLRPKKPKQSEFAKRIKTLHKTFKKVNRFVSRNLAARSTSYKGR